jgi:serine/threonine protein kinase
VYQAEDARPNRPVGLKFLPGELSGDRVALERFRREAQAPSALSHPNVCTTYDIGEWDGRQFIAMEFLDGETRKERTSGTALRLRGSAGIRDSRLEKSQGRVRGAETGRRQKGYSDVVTCPRELNS